MVLQRLQSLQRAGVQTLPRSRPDHDHAGRPAVAASVSVPPVAAPPAPVPALAAPALPEEAAEQPERRRLLAELRQEITACVACRELASTRTQTVFGSGNLQARLCFCGEAPGADEDRVGEPFVGRAGKLLTDMIERGMRLNRAEVYILNTIKCRPPGNRTPSSEEVGNCRHFFERQMELLQPEFLCCLGAVAAQAVLATTKSIGQLRGRFYDYRGVRVICTYHPAYLLRNPAAKKEAWKDLQLLMDAMGLTAGSSADS
jgi:DNA polymerase